MKRTINLSGKGFAKNYTKIGGSDVTNHIGVPYFMDVVLGGHRLQNEPLITISKQKKIVETSIVGSESLGAVKEFISAGDYAITIEGVITDPKKKQFPQDEYEKLISILEKREALDFSNQLAERLGVYKVVVKGYSFGKDQGRMYSQSYKITLVSDRDFYGVLTLR
ncbi:conserved hypothetical protein [Tenacibaculum sp. 190524A02b]|uniref:DUF6046 domain-containing protein n=1 Tax=Tenacibaculum vairaonense TaxID=3137860 RepID=A0ABM9PQV2_9FLAO